MNPHFKGPGRKENPPLRDSDLSPNLILFNYFYTGYKRSIYGKNLTGPMKSLRAKSNCRVSLMKYEGSLKGDNDLGKE